MNHYLKKYCKYKLLPKKGAFNGRERVAVLRAPFAASGEDQAASRASALLRPAANRPGAVLVAADVCFCFFLCFCLPPELLSLLEIYFRSKLWFAQRFVFAPPASRADRHARLSRVSLYCSALFAHRSCSRPPPPAQIATPAGRRLIDEYVKTGQARFSVLR